MGGAFHKRPHMSSIQHPDALEVNNWTKNNTMKPPTALKLSPDGTQTLNVTWAMSS